jgi:hypothetical protein
MNLRRGAIAGGVVAVVSASGTAAISEAPLPTFLFVLAVAVVFGLPAVGMVALVDRVRRRSAG